MKIVGLYWQAGQFVGVVVQGAGDGVDDGLRRPAGNQVHDHGQAAQQEAETDHHRQDECYYLVAGQSRHAGADGEETAWGRSPTTWPS